MGVSLKLEPNTSRSCWLLFLSPLLAASWLSLAMATTAMATATAMAMATAMDTATDMATATDTMATMARGRLSLLPLLRLLLSPDMATTAVDTVTAMATAMDMATVTA